MRAFSLDSPRSAFASVRDSAAQARHWIAPEHRVAGSRGCRRPQAALQTLRNSVRTTINQPLELSDGHGVAAAAARERRRRLAAQRPRGVHRQSRRRPQARVSGIPPRCAEVYAGRRGAALSGREFLSQAGAAGFQVRERRRSCSQARSRSVTLHNPLHNRILGVSL
jgi:hypothetical protein